jgi:hypothetical protein
MKSMQSHSDTQGMTRDDLDALEASIVKHQEALEKLVDAAEIGASPVMDQIATADKKATIIASAVVIMLVKGFIILDKKDQPIAIGSDSNYPKTVVDLAGLHLQIETKILLYVILAISSYFLISFLCSTYRTLGRWRVRRVLWGQKAGIYMKIPIQEYKDAATQLEELWLKNEAAIEKAVAEGRRIQAWRHLLDQVERAAKELWRRWNAGEIKKPEAPPTTPLRLPPGRIQGRGPPPDDLIEDMIQTSVDGYVDWTCAGERDEFIGIMRKCLVSDRFNRTVGDRLVEATAGVLLREKDGDIFREIMNLRASHKVIDGARSDVDKRVKAVSNTRAAMRNSYIIGALFDILFPISLLALAFVWTLRS